jgi:hypothetical protein
MWNYVGEVLHLRSTSTDIVWIKISCVQTLKKENTFTKIMKCVKQLRLHATNKRAKILDKKFQWVFV